MCVQKLCQGRAGRLGCLTPAGPAWGDLPPWAAPSAPADGQGGGGRASDLALGRRVLDALGRLVQCPGRGLGPLAGQRAPQRQPHAQGFVWWAIAVSWFIFNALIAKITARC